MTTFVIISWVLCSFHMNSSMHDDWTVTVNGMLREVMLKDYNKLLLKNKYRKKLYIELHLKQHSYAVSGFEDFEQSFWVAQSEQMFDRKEQKSACVDISKWLIFTDIKREVSWRVGQPSRRIWGSGLHRQEHSKIKYILFICIKYHWPESSGSKLYKHT